MKTFLSLVTALLLSVSAHAQTFQDNLNCAGAAIDATPISDYQGNLAYKFLLQKYVLLAGIYAPMYPSLSKMILNAAIQRVDGCALRGSPDSYLVGGPYGVDYIVVCPSQAVPYACLSAAQAQLP